MLYKDVLIWVSVSTPQISVPKENEFVEMSAPSLPLPSI